MSLRMIFRGSKVAAWVWSFFCIAVFSMGRDAAQGQAGAEKPVDASGGRDASARASRGSSDWIQFRADATGTGCIDDGFAFPPALMWKYSSKPLNLNPASALITEGVVYYCSDKYVYALDSETGSLLWWQQTEEPIRATPVLAESILCVPSVDGKLYAYRADSGAVEWIFPTNGPLRSSPVFSDGKILFGSNDGNVYCLAAAKAEVVWKYSTGGEVMSSPACSGGNVFVLSNDSNLYCLKAKSGQLYWRTPITGSGQMLSSPAVGGGSVWVAAGRTLYGARAQTGRVEYSISTGDNIVSSPVMNKDTVFIGSRDGNMYAIDTRSGRTRWKTPLEDPVLSTATIVNDKLLVGTEKGFVFGLQTKDGQVIWKYQIHPGSKVPNNVAAEPSVARGSLYVVGDDGALYGFKPWGIDLAPPVAIEAKIKLKARDGSMVYYPLDTTDYLKSVPVPQFRGVPPITFSVTVEDEGSGLDESTMSVTLNGEPKKVTFQPESGLLEAELGPQIKPGVAMRPIPDGESTVLLSIKDWQGNLLEKKYRIIVNNQLPPPEPPEKSEKGTPTPKVGAPAGSKAGSKAGYGPVIPQ